VATYERSADELLKQARRYEDAFRFEDAYREYLRAADAFHARVDGDDGASMNSEPFALMRAGQCLEMLQPWRAHTAIWERLGNLLGNSIDTSLPFRTPKAEGQHNLYHIISYTEWLEGLHGVDDLARLSWKRQQQAWAYSWAAEEAEENNRYVLAARLYRKAAVTWTLNAPLRSESGRLVGRAALGSKDPEHRNLLELSGPWLEGARCYYKAALCAQSSGDAESLARILEPWVPAENEWGRSSDEYVPVDSGRSDLERLQECWTNYLGLARSGTSATVSADRQVAGLEDYARQLTDVQRGYARRGERKRAIRVYRRRQQILDQAHIVAGHRLRFFVRKLYWWTTGSGSSMGRAFLTAGLLYLIVFPLIFCFWSKFEVSIPPTQPHFADALVFSIGNVVSITSTRFTTPSLLVSAMQASEAITGYLVLGYIVWLALRSYEQ
jgi:hypothetical protein